MHPSIVEVLKMDNNKGKAFVVFPNKSFARQVERHLPKSIRQHCRLFAAPSRYHVASWVCNLFGTNQTKKVTVVLGDGDDPMYLQEKELLDSFGECRYIFFDPRSRAHGAEYLVQHLSKNVIDIFDAT